MPINLDIKRQAVLSFQAQPFWVRLNFESGL